VGERREQLSQWLSDQCGLHHGSLEPASGDASFRRYFRTFDGGRSYIAVDAPPEQEDSRPFARIAGWLVEWGLTAPRIIEMDLERGFMLLSDLGTRLYLHELEGATVERLYGDALGALAVMQVHGSQVVDQIPPYDEALLRSEMALFDEWYLNRHLSLRLTGEQQAILATTYQRLAESALGQPRVFVHRDYHSRNLTCTPQNNPGILDFQDAVWGPCTYDLVSLLRDCYIQWPVERVRGWALGYLELARQSGVLPSCDEDQFMRWFDLMGMQRHLKATGIFARLNYRDGKPGYLPDIPRTLGYVNEVCANYPEFSEFRTMLAEMKAMPEDRVSENGP